MWVLLLLIMSSPFACVPNTYYDISDPYAYGLRWYDRGRYDLAAQYWDPLVEKGDCDAEYHVGLMYFLGQGKPRDSHKALEMWRKAAEGNHPKAQSALGDVLYQNEAVTFHHCKTCTVPKDLVQAYVWYKLMQKSARYDGEKAYAARALAAVSAELSIEQRNQAEARVNQWKPTPADCKPRNWW
jgi:TPR repeat protein